MNIYNTEQRINNLYKVNNAIRWAKQQLKILHDMLEKRKDEWGPAIWYVKQIHKIIKGLKTVQELENEL